MATPSFSLFFISLISFLPLIPCLSPPYLSSPAILFKDYDKMITSFKIYIYTEPNPFTFTTPPPSLFQASLLKSPFLTQDPNEAHLFFVPFSPELSPRSLARLIRDLRTRYPYWNRTLGADHFFLSPAGIDYSSDRNALELKKNSVQISTFPVNTAGYFVPHKDITLPPFNPSPIALPHVRPVNKSPSLLGYAKWDGEAESSLGNELRKDPDFVIGSEPSEHVESMERSKFCLFHRGSDVAWMAEAMALGCVPVVIVDRVIQDLPLMDVLKWSDISLLVRSQGGAQRLKEVLLGVAEEQYERMRESCVTASKHLVWNAEPQPQDAFHMVMYQLWLRRHTIRYARWEFL